MASSEDTEITLGTGKLLVLFFGLVIVCALFFALGYSIARKSEPSFMAVSAASPQQPSPDTKKAGGGSAAATQPMTFYKSVEQKGAGPELTQAAEAKTDSAPNPATPTSTESASTSTTDPAATLPTAGYFVQVAAVTKQEDADALVDALKKKQYPAFVAAQSQASADKFFRVQVGPFSDIKDAEAMRTRLISDGYSPIVKK
jgi:cell division septation protein DedD